MKIQIPALLFLAALGCAAPASAAVLSVGSYTKTTDGDQTFSSIFNGGAQMFNFDSGNVYVVMTTTFSNPVNPGVLDVTSSYGGYSHSGGDVYGQLWQQNTLGIAYYGERGNIGGVTLVPGTSMTLVVKYELNGVGLDGDTIKFWVNPTLGTGVEGTPDDADPTRLWGPTTISSDDMRFRRGNDSENTIDFANIVIYSGGDSPFAAVPEPGVALLGALGLLGLVRRRR